MICSFLAVDPLFYQLSPYGWLLQPSVMDSLQLDKHEKLYSFGSEQHGISFYLKSRSFAQVVVFMLGFLCLWSSEISNALRVR